MSKLARAIRVVGLITMDLMVVAPAGAGAATTIGETFTPTASIVCVAGNTRLQDVSPGDTYAAPTDGVITQWNFQAPGDPPQLKFKVGRPTGNVNEFTMIGESGVVSPAANSLNSYFLRIPVEAGDIIGTYSQTTGICSSVQQGFNFHFITSDVVPPTTAVFPNPGGALQLDLSALLEPDADNDGFGDETQDKCLGQAGPNNGCSAATCNGKPATIIGTNGNNKLRGTPGRDVMVGLEGNDKLSGLAGNDLICGGSGKDTLNGGKGKDTLRGQKGKDTLKGGPGKDTLKGGAGKDKQVQ